MEKEVAIVGSGMAGLTAGYLFRRAGWRVTVFESAPQRGMDAHTVSVPVDGGHGWVDAPLRVMSPTGWRSVLALCQDVGVGTFPVDVPVSMSWLDRSTWMRTGTLHLGNRTAPILGAWRYLGWDALRIGRDLARLHRHLRNPHQDESHDGKGPPQKPETVSEFFTNRGYATVFWRGFLLPLLGTVTTCRLEYLLQYPAQDLLMIVRDLLFGRPMLRLMGGTKALVNQLSRDVNFVSGSPVMSVTEVEGPPSAPRVCVTNARGDVRYCHRLIIATQANDAGFLGPLCQDEKALLREVVFDQGELVTHRDTSLMPRRSQDWTPLNYLMDRAFSNNMFTVWVNPVEPSIAKADPIFQSWNPMVPLDESLVIHRVKLQRAVQTPKSLDTLTRLQRLQDDPHRSIYFCGSWSYPGVPLLESAVRSAIKVAQTVGLKVPWDPLTRGATL